MNNLKRKRKLAKPKKVRKQNYADSVQDSSREVKWNNFHFFSYIPLPKGILGDSVSALRLAQFFAISRCNFTFIESNVIVGIAEF